MIPKPDHHGKDPAVEGRPHQGAEPERPSRDEQE
jgi:hypothetical protein